MHFAKRKSYRLRISYLPVFTKLYHITFIRILQHWRDQSPINRHNILIEERSLVPKRAIHNGMFLNCHGYSLGNECGHGNTLGFDLLVECIEGVHFNFTTGTEDGTVHCCHHVVGYGALHSREGNQALGHFDGGGCTRRGSLAFGFRYARGNLDIVGSDTSESTSTHDGGKVQLGLLGQDTSSRGSGNDSCGGCPRWLGWSCHCLLGGCSTRRGILNIGGGDTFSGSSSCHGTSIHTHFRGHLFRQWRSNNTPAS
mmetsp:Transcript_4095/g.9282  ORF Transcript_4095/g.9282 Transcript_4095/m.9282 type:complete len:255 (-) Transcript_4095:253-1017(-)